MSGMEGREILRSPLEEFSQGQPLRVIHYVKASPQGMTLRRAMGRLGEQDYNLLFNNCCLLYTSPSPRDKRQARMPSSA